jgi:hypothetical protein
MSKVKRIIFQIILTVLIGLGASFLFAETSYASKSVDEKNEPQSSLMSVGLFSEMRTVRNEDQILLDSQISGLEVGLIRGDFAFLLEGNASKSNAGRDQIILLSKRNEVFFWTHWIVFKTKYLGFYGGLGVGGAKTTVESKIIGDYSKDESGIEGIGGGSLGFQLNLFKNRLALQVEERGLMAKSFDPSPTSSLLFKLIFIEPFFE